MQAKRTPRKIVVHFPPLSSRQKLKNRGALLLLFKRNTNTRGALILRTNQTERERESEWVSEREEERKRLNASECPPPSASPSLSLSRSLSLSLSPPPLLFLPRERARKISNFYKIYFSYFIKNENMILYWLFGILDNFIDLILFTIIHYLRTKYSFLVVYMNIFQSSYFV